MAHRLPLFISLLSVAIAYPCFADVTGSGAGGDIPDHPLPGAVSTIQISDSEIIENARFCIEDLTHTWVGDLTATISHVDTNGNQAVARLFYRTGKAQSSGPGDASDLGGTYFFRDDAALPNGDWWAAAGSTGNNPGDTIAGGAANPYRASDQSGAFVDLDTIFGGRSTAGTWTLRINDEDPEETGSFSGWTAEFITAVPEPTTGMALLGLGFLALRRRRK